MRLQWLDIRTLPGIHPGFRIDEFAPGANFITGPNASGKSSTIRALRYLLSPPEAGDPAHLDLQARFELDGHAWQVRRQAGHVEWEFDGRPAERPGLPSGSALGSYLITVEDLFRLQGSSEQRLSERIRRELNEGFDLGALRQGRFQIQPRIGQSEQRELNQKRRALADIDADQREVAGQERRLPELDRQIEQARAAEREARALETALELVAARREAAELQARREAFPDGMDRLLGKESERLAELQQTVETLESHLADQRRARQQALEQLAESGLAEGRPDEDALAGQQAAAAQLQDRERQLDEARAAMADADAAFDAACLRLQLERVDAERLPEPDAANLRQAQALADDLEGELQHRRTLEQQLESITDEPGGKRSPDTQRAAGTDPDGDERTIERYQRAVHALQDWMVAPQSNGAAWILSGLLAAGGGFAALTGYRSGPIELTWAGIALLVLAVAVPWLGARLSARSRRRHAESQLETLRIDAPDDWTRASVRERLEELERGADELRAAMERQRRRDALADHLEQTGREIERLEHHRREMARTLGFDPCLTTRAMAQFLRDLEVFHQTRLAQRQALQHLERLQSERRDLLDRIRAFLDPWRTEEPGDSAEFLAESLRGLQQRARQARDAEHDLHQARREIQRLEHELDEARGRIDALYREAGLEPGQQHELEERLRRLKDWRELNRKLDLAREAITVRQRALEDRPDLKAKARSDQAEALSSELDRARERAATLGTLHEERGEIRTLVDRTGRDHAREKALGELSMAADALERIRDGVIEAELAHFLLDEIEREHRRKSEPPLLKLAREAFGAFTHRQWDLEFVEHADGIGFQARDLALGERRGLAELSTATRMQLLLALRMGQIGLAEHGAANLPLIIDEALTTSDHERAAVIMQNLQQLADDGRQIIYLAAGEHEYRLWEHATGKAPQRIDLAAVRRTRAVEPGPEFALPERRTVPKPDGNSAADYAAILGVSAINPRDPPDAVHIFHLLPDRLETLHRLLESWRITSLGQLEGLLGSDVARTAVPDDAERKLLAQRCQITRDWFEAWRIGRGRPVTRGTLERALDDGGLTETTLDGVVEKAEAVDGNTEALLESLEHDPIKMATGTERRIGKPQLQAFAEFLAAKGHRDQRTPLTGDQRRGQLIERLSTAIGPETIHAQIDWLEATVSESIRTNTCKP